MKAFVKTNKGTFPNVNFFLAWEAFNTMGYSVTCFEEEDIDTLDITVDTPVFAGVTIFRKIIDKLGINYPPFDCYPKVLNQWYGRDIRVSTLGEERFKFNKNPKPVFVKPIKPKEFVGNVWASTLNLIPLANKGDDVPCYVCDPIDIESEFRVYVHDGDILGVKHYYGKWNVVPDKFFVNTVVKDYKPSPIAYGVDIGVTRSGSCFVIEVNDGCNLGNYGLDSIHYGEILVARWFEIMAENNLEKDKIKTLEQFKNSDYVEKIKAEYEISDFDGTGKSLKEILLPAERKKLRQESMKSFAMEVQKSLKESEI